MALEKKADSLDRYVKAYETGDYSAALGAFRSAALDGSPRAQYYLGLMYRDGIAEKQEDPLACAAPHIVSVSFDDVRAEVLLHAMAEKGVSISAGSACSSNHPDISRTLKAIGVPKEHLDSTVRFSFSFDSDREQVDYCINALKEVLPVLRRYVPGGRKKRR